VPFGTAPNSRADFNSPLLQTRGNVASGPASADDTDTLPTMTTLLLSVVAELTPTLPSLIYDPFASHCVRILLLVMSGVPASSSDPKARGERSKKSAQFRKGQGATFGRNWLADDAALAKADPNGKGKGKATTAERFAIPTEFRQALREMHESLNALDTAGIDFATGNAVPSAGAVAGEGVRRAAMHEVAGPVVRILVELEALEGWTPGGWADRILCGLVTQVEAGESSSVGSDLREEYLAGLLRHPASSPTFEMLLRLAPKPVFDALWSDFFEGKLQRLAANAVANFVVAVGVSRVDEVQMQRLVRELKAVPTERRGEWIDNFRTGVLRALMESATRLSACEGEVVDVRGASVDALTFGNELLMTEGLTDPPRHFRPSHRRGEKARRALCAHAESADGMLHIARSEIRFRTVD
jgi:nucleolar protein 9